MSGESTYHQPYTLFAAPYDAAWGRFSAYVAELVVALESEREHPFAVVCDAACGSGHLLQHLANDGRSLTGFDRSRQMIERARKRLPGARFVLGDLRDPPMFDVRFDLVTCVYDSLNYLLEEAELRNFFDWGWSVLEEGGAVLVDLNGSDIYERDQLLVRNHLVNGEAFRQVQRHSSGPPPRVTTEFVFAGGTERHVQRPWEVDEVEGILSASRLRHIDTLDVLDDSTGSASGKVVYLATR